MVRNATKLVASFQYCYSVTHPTFGREITLLFLVMGAAKLCYFCGDECSFLISSLDIPSALLISASSCKVSVV